MDHLAIDSRIESIADALSLLVRRLQVLGYDFADSQRVLPGPESDVDSSIRRIEAEVGPVPYALAAFWRRVGSIDLRGSHHEWIGCDYPDPLVIEPVSVAITELDEFIADREERMRYEFPYAIPISGDEYHKEDVSGGMWYNVSCPATSADPVINAERHHKTFLGYLELALKWGGFPGLDRVSGHTWPIQHLAINITATA